MFRRLTLCALSLLSFTVYRSHAADESTIKTGFDKLIASLKGEDKKTYYQLVSSHEPELKNSADISSLTWGTPDQPDTVMPGDITVQFFQYSDNKTRRTCRRLNKAWNNAVQLNVTASGYIDSPFYTDDQRTIGEKLIGAPEKIVFRDHTTEMLTSLMRSGNLQYQGSFKLGMAQDNEAGMKLLAESLKDQKRVSLLCRVPGSNFDTPTLIRSLTSNKHLTELDLHMNFLQKNDLKAVLDLINANGNIKHLNIPYDTYDPKRLISSDDRGMNYVKKILENNTSLHSLTVVGVPVTKTNEKQAITKEEIILVSDALTKNTTLQNLYLPLNNGEISAKVLNNLSRLRTKDKRVVLGGRQKHTPSS